MAHTNALWVQQYHLKWKELTSLFYSHNRPFMEETDSWKNNVECSEAHSERRLRVFLGVSGPCSPRMSSRTSSPEVEDQEPARAKLSDADPQGSSGKRVSSNRISRASFRRKWRHDCLASEPIRRRRRRGRRCSATTCELFGKDHFCQRGFGKCPFPTDGAGVQSVQLVLRQR